MLAVPKGSRLGLSYIASAAPLRVTPFAVLRSIKTGHVWVDALPVLTTFTVDRTRQELASVGKPIPESAEVVGAVIEGAGAGKRGQFYAELEYRVSGDNFSELCRGYFYAGFTPSLGDRIESGPGGGEGFLSWVAAFAGDRAGNAAAVDFPLFATNALRKIHGVAWYYHSNGTAATRTLNAPYLNGIGGTKPTGFTLTGTNARFWGPSANITLTVNEEGSFISLGEGKDGLATRNDEGVTSFDSSASAPAPWPLWVTEDDTDSIIRFPAVTTGQAGDVHSAYVLIEEWLVI